MQSLQRCGGVLGIVGDKAQQEEVGYLRHVLGYILSWFLPLFPLSASCPPSGGHPTLSQASASMMFCPCIQGQAAMGRTLWNIEPKKSSLIWLLSVRKANIPCFSYIAEKISHPLCQWATNRRVERNCTTPSSEKLEGGWVLPYLRSREKKYYETKNKIQEAGLI